MKKLLHRDPQRKHGGMQNMYSSKNIFYLKHAYAREVIKVNASYKGRQVKGMKDGETK